MNFINEHIAEILITMLGLMIGSFLNVVIHRVPRRESIVFPSSRCPECGTTIRFYDNIPLFSFLLLRGKCRHCSASISWRYPAIEVLTAVLFLSFTVKNGLQWALIPNLLFASAIVTLIFIDAEHKILPNVVIYPMFVLLVGARALIPDTFSQVRVAAPADLTDLAALSLAAAGLVIVPLLMFGLDYSDWVLIGRKLPGALDPEDDDTSGYGKHILLVSVILGVIFAITVAVLLSHEIVSPLSALIGVASALIGAVLSGGVFWLLRMMYFVLKRREGMGLGDAKMMMMVGAFIGWKLGLLTTFVGALAGSVIAGGYILVRKRDANTEIPFGVFLGIGALFSLFYGRMAIELWLGMVG